MFISLVLKILYLLNSFILNLNVHFKKTPLPSSFLGFFWKPLKMLFLPYKALNGFRSEFMKDNLLLYKPSYLLRLASDILLKQPRPLLLGHAVGRNG